MRHDSIEADSIVKSARNADPTLSSKDSDTALGKVEASASDSTSTEADATVEHQRVATDSLNHVRDNVVTAGKITDPEQEFQQGDTNCNAVPALRS